MSSCRETARRTLLGLTLAAAAAGALAQTAYPGVGRAATPKEVQAWDIDVRPDFKGLPKGAGSVAKGMDVWEGKCASCHGIFGESNEVFSPLVGGTSKDDIQTGRVARLTDTGFPGRTTLMKVPTVSTLWDYINRAMPWTAPKSLSIEEVYAVTAYMLNMGGIVPDDFVLSDTTMAQAQARLPNRNGMTTDHGMWPGKGLGNGGKPDVKPVACMANCATEPKVASFLPDFARNNHGNLAEQQRMVGPQRGGHRRRGGRGCRHRGAQGGRRRQPGRGRAGLGAEAQLHRLPRGGQQDRRPQLPRDHGQVRHAGRRRGLPGRQDQGRWPGRLGPDPDATTGPARQRRQATGPMAGRRRQEVAAHPGFARSSPRPPLSTLYA